MNGCKPERKSRLDPVRETLLLLAMMTLATSVVAEDAHRFHIAPTISNDSIGDWHDRWRSSSVEVGILVGANGTDTLPTRLGQLREYRFRSDVLMPADITTPNPRDRRHAGVLAFGLHSYAGLGEVDLRIGGDLVMIGEQTGLYDVQTRLHRILGFDRPNLPDFQIENTVRLDISSEAGIRMGFSNGTIRPFMEIRIGTEDLFRTGVDLALGTKMDNLMMRVDSTGHRVPYGIIRKPGFAFVAGVDVAWVDDSLYLPETFGYSLTQPRIRIRGGTHYIGNHFDAFYGLAWLGKEFQKQPEGQFVGTLQVRFDFF